MWVGRIEQTTLRQGRLNGPDSQHNRSRHVVSDPSRDSQGPSEFLQLFNNVHCFFSWFCPRFKIFHESESDIVGTPNWGVGVSIRDSNCAHRLLICSPRCELFIGFAMMVILNP